LTSDADVAVADLEDSVSPSAKDEARSRLAQLRPRVVRVNGAGTPWFTDDLAMCVELDVEYVVLPKATPESVRAVDRSLRILAIVETPQGLREAYETASEPHVHALFLGSADLSAALRLEERVDGLELSYARTKLVVDSAAAGVRPPVDGPQINVHDLNRLGADACLARMLGFGGKICVHPKQVQVVNRCFAPSEDDIAWAARVVDAYRNAETEGMGVLTVDGMMIDRPVVERARDVLREAGFEHA
jgi:citrate lyase beta subunit